MSIARISAVALAAALSVGSAVAADQMIDLSSGQASFQSMGGVLAGGDDVLTFFGLAPGLYNFAFSVSAQFVTGFGGDVNGTPFAVAVLGPISAGAAFGVDTAPFTVTLVGTAGAKALYSGELTVSAVVPEPSTYALFAAGLGIMGWLSRSRFKRG